MKKSILLLMILSITLLSCDRVLSKPDPKLATSTGLSKANFIKPEKAIQMIRYYNDSNFKKDPGAIIKQITMYNSDFYEIFKLYPNTTRIKLLPAAYIDDSVEKHSKNEVTLIIQLKVGYNSEYFYYDINDFGAGRICPPPLGCSPNIFEDL